MNPGRARLYATTLLACLASLLIAYAIKVNCPTQNTGTYPGLCYSDIAALYHGRGFDQGVVPYFDFPPGGSFDDPGFLEYPVLTGAVAGLTSLPSSTREEYLAWNAVVLGAMTLVAAALLTGIVGLSALRWSLAPALVLFVFNNWDIMAVGCVVAGCAAAARGRHGWGGFWFGIGAAAKLFPAVFVAPLILDRISQGDRRGALGVVAAAGAAVLVPNAAIAVLTDGWWATYRFHSQRGADVGSVWAWILPHGISSLSVNLVTNLALLLGGVALLFVGWRRRESGGAYPVLPVGSALLALLIVTSKIASPQQALWLLPSLTLLATGFRWWLAWNGWAILVFFISFGAGLLWYDPSMVLVADGVGAFVRVILATALIFVFLAASPRRFTRRQGMGTWSGWRTVPDHR